MEVDSMVVAGSEVAVPAMAARAAAASVVT